MYKTTHLYIKAKWNVKSVNENPAWDNIFIIKKIIILATLTCFVQQNIMTNDFQTILTTNICFWKCHAKNV